MLDGVKPEVGLKFNQLPCGVALDVHDRTPDPLFPIVTGKLLTPVSEGLNINVAWPVDNTRDGVFFGICNSAV
jgi:hypothetical protein